MTHRTEACYRILKVGVVGIHLHAVLTKVGYLARNAHIKDEAQRIDGRVRSRVEIVYLIVLTEALSQTVHATIEATCLVAQDAQTILAVWGVCSALRRSRSCKCRQKSGSEYFFHYQMFIFRYSFQNLVATAYLPLLGTEKDYWLQNY